MSDARRPTTAELISAFKSELASADRVVFEHKNALGCYDSASYKAESFRAALDALLAKAREDALREASEECDKSRLALIAKEYILALIEKDKP